MSKGNVRLSPVRFGFAMGLWWGIGMLILGWFGHFFQYGISFIQIMSSVYLGFQPTIVGGIIGGIWGFIDFFVFCFLAACVYNCCACCKSNSCDSQSTGS